MKSLQFILIALITAIAVSCSKPSKTFVYPRQWAPGVHIVFNSDSTAILQFPATWRGGWNEGDTLFVRYQGEMGYSYEAFKVEHGQLYWLEMDEDEISF